MFIHDYALGRPGSTGKTRFEQRSIHLRELFVYKGRDGGLGLPGDADEPDPVMIKGVTCSLFDDPRHIAVGTDARPVRQIEGACDPAPGRKHLGGPDQQAPGADVLRVAEKRFVVVNAVDSHVQDDPVGPAWLDAQEL